MFGYVTVDKSNLLVKDYDAYKAVYCSLCKQIGKEYSRLSRVILSYDCTFFALVAMAYSADCPGFKKGRCTVNPLKQCDFCLGGTDALSMASALSVLSVYYKLIDNIADSGFFKSTFCRILLCYFKGKRKKAAQKYPEIDTALSNMIDMQTKAESDKNCCIDKAAEPTAVMLSKVMELVSEDEKQRLILHSFGYFLGKWIYLMDASNDFDDDIKDNSFNPYVIAYGEDKAQCIDKMRESMLYCLSEALLSYNLMELNRFNPIIENILTKGLVKRQKEVLNIKTEKDI